jgi:hypothetical protein
MVGVKKWDNLGYFGFGFGFGFGSDVLEFAVVHTH